MIRRWAVAIICGGWPDGGIPIGLRDGIGSAAALACVAPGMIEQRGAGHEDDAGAGREQQPAADARVAIDVMEAPFHGAQGEGVDHREGFPPGLDDEQSAETSEHDQT